MKIDRLFRFRRQRARPLGIIAVPGLALALLAANAPAAVTNRSSQPTSSSLSLDQNFRASAVARPATPSRALFLADGKYLLFRDPDTLTDRRAGALTRYLADGTYDPSFNCSRDYQFVGAVAPLPNGQFIVAATQHAYNEKFGTERILRLNADGSIDPSFTIQDVDPAPIGYVWMIAIQPDGRILASGGFIEFAGAPRQRIARLLADGAFDPSFTSPQFSNGSGIWAQPLVLADGKIIIAGDFTTLNGITTKGVARLNVDGSVDTTFNATGFSRNAAIRCVISQPGGKIVLAGRFRRTGSSAQLPLIRLNSDGSLDSTYGNGVSFPSSVSARDLASQTDGKLVAAAGNSIYRFNTDGSVDGTFTQAPMVDATNLGTLGTAQTVSVQPDGRIFVAGNFTDVGAIYYDSSGHFGVARLDASGNLDPTFAPSQRTGLDSPPSSFRRLPDGSTLAAFGYSQGALNSGFFFNFARFLADGSLAAGPVLSSSDPNSTLTRGLLVQDFTQLADGRLYVVGNEPYYGPAAAAFLPDGVEDLGFRAVFYSNGPAHKDIGLSNGKLLTVDTNYPLLWRVRGSGGYDTTFRPDPSIYNSTVVFVSGLGITDAWIGNNFLAAQPDGKFLFIYFSSDSLFHLVRLNVDGSLDSTFAGATMTPFDVSFGYPTIYDPFTGTVHQPFNGAYFATPPLFDAEVLPDGKIIIAGRFTSFNGVAARGLIRLEANGSVDPSFAVGGGAQWTQTPETASSIPAVEQIEPQVDGKLLIAGTFEAFNGAPAPGLARLYADGSVDSSFAPPVTERKKFRRGNAKLQRQADGSFLLSGPYSFPGESEPSFIHISSTGGIPVVGSPLLATAVVGRPFSYQIVASGGPVSYGASGLPQGFSVNNSTGVITGQATAANIGTYVCQLTATNGEGTSSPAALQLTVPAFPQLTAAASRKTHGAPPNAQDFDIDLPLAGTAGVECRPSSNNEHMLIFTFNTEINRGEASVTAGGASLSRPLSFDDHKMILFLNNVTNAQTVAVTLHNLTDPFLQTLPDITVRVSFLLGDTNGNGSVNASDVAQTKSQSGQPISATNFRADVNTSGAINASDVALVKSSVGTMLPP